MILLSNLSHYMDICSLFKFGNRSWSGTPFSTQNDYLGSDSHGRFRSIREKGVQFDFSDSLKVM